MSKHSKNSISEDGHNSYSITESIEQKCLMNDIATLYTENILPDITLIIGPQKKRIQAHKAILAVRCSYFYSIFEKDPTALQLEFPNVDPDHLKVILDFIYTTKMEVNTRNALFVLELSKTFPVNRVIEKCITAIKDMVTNDNIFYLLEYSRRNAQFHELHSYCVTFLEINAKELFSHKSFLKISKDTLIYLLRSDKIQLPELEIFLHVIEWGKYQLKRKEEEIQNEKEDDIFLIQEAYKYFMEEAQKKEDTNMENCTNMVPTNQSNNPSQTIQQLTNQSSSLVDNNGPKMEYFEEGISNEQISKILDYTNDPIFTKKLKNFLVDVFPYIRFPLLTPTECYDIVERSGVVKKDLLLEAYRSHALSNRSDVISPRLRVREGCLYYVKGVCENVHMDMLKGWTLCYHVPYCEPTTEEVFTKIKGTRMLVGAKNRNSKVLAICAMGRRDRILIETVENQTTKENGVYWYHWKNHSFGFSSTENINLGSADIADGRLKLSWHLTGRGGYRLGELKNLNNSRNFEKLIFYAP